MGATTRQQAQTVPTILQSYQNATNERPIVRIHATHCVQQRLNVTNQSTLADLVQWWLGSLTTRVRQCYNHLPVSHATCAHKYELALLCALVDDTPK